MNATDPAWLLNFLLGAVFVMLYATARFRGPESDRSLTTFQRYSFSTLYFGLGHLGIYLLGICVLWAGEMLPGTDADSFLASVPSWLAVLTAAVLPRLKPLSILDTMFRSHARNIGGMLTEALRLRDAIIGARLTLGEDEFRELHFGLLRRGVDVGSHRSLPDETLHAQILHAGQLKFLLDRCARHRAHAAFARDNARAIGMIARRFDHLMFRTSRSIDTVGQLHQLTNTMSGRSGNWESLGALAENESFASEAAASTIGPAANTTRMLITNLREDMRYFINDVALLLARMTLRQRWTERGRVKMLGTLGIHIEPLERPRFRSLIAVFGCVALFMAVAQTTRAGDATPGEMLQGLVMVSLMFVIAVLCAVYPKQYFAFANPNIHGRPPYLFFFVSGAAAAALAFVVGLIFRLLRFQNGEQALQNAWQNSPWLIMTFTLAFTLAVLVQDTRGVRDRRHDFMRSLRDAAVLGISLTIAMGAVQLLLRMTRPDFAVARPGLLLMGLGLGAFIGFYIPKRFRSVYSLSPARGELRVTESAVRMAERIAGRVTGAFRTDKGVTS